MPRHKQTIKLPDFCPYHTTKVGVSMCAYTGLEPDRCPICHTTTHQAEDHPDYPPYRRAPCLCDFCGELFVSISSFNRHQRPYGVCRFPDERGLVLIEQVDREGTIWQMWANPGEMPKDAHI